MRKIIIFILLTLFSLENIAQTTNHLFFGQNRVRQQVQPDSPLLEDLVAWWELDEESGTVMYDSSDNGLDGTVSGATINQTGKVNKAYDLEASEVDYIRLPNANFNFAKTDSFSVSMWVKTESLNNGFLFAKMIGTFPDFTGYAFLLETDGDITFFLCAGDFYANKLYGRTIESVSNGVWTHLVVTYDGSTALSGIKIYKNGVQSTSWSSSENTITGVISNAANTNIGAFNDGSSPFDGLIDQVATWNRELNFDEISELYNDNSGISFSSLEQGQQQSYTLTVTENYLNDATTENSGSIAKASDSYQQGTTVTIAADFPNSGANFAGYFYDSAGTQSCNGTATVNQNLTVYAVYDYTTPVIPEILTNLVAWYEMDETTGTNMTDSHINSLNGTIYGAAIDQTGKVNKAYNFDGTNDYCEIPYSSDFYMTDKLTIMGCVKWEYTGLTQNMIALPYSTSAHTSPYFSYAIHGLPDEGTGFVNMRLWMNTSAGYRDSGTAEMSLGEWHFVVGTYDGTTAKLFIDNAEVSSNTYGSSASIAMYSNPIYIGKTGGNKEYAKGLIDEVKIFKEAFTPSQISSFWKDGDILTYYEASTGDQTAYYTLTVTESYLNDATSQNSGSVSPDSKQYIADATVTISNDFTNNGDNFEGFFYDAAGTNPATSFNISSDIAIYAVYDYTIINPIYTVTVTESYLNDATPSNSGSVSPDSQDIEGGTEITLSSYFINSGSNFTGFFTDAAGTTPIASFEVTVGVTIYAVYDYTIPAGDEEDFGTTADYFVSYTDGNDSNNGTSISTPWKTLSKVNATSFAAGKKIAFKAGDSWAGTLTPAASGTSGNPIIYGAYGVGEKPKIYGSTEITGWTLHSGNIYKATVGQEIRQLFIDGERQKLARYPNEGYFLISSVQSSTQFTCSSLNGGINYSGATWVGRTSAFTMYSKTVTGSSSQTITVDSAPTYGLGVNEGFFLVNKLIFLDSAGEWFYDSSTGTVYLWTPSGDSPINYEIRGAIYDNGIYLDNKDYISVKNLIVLHSKKHGVYSNGDSDNFIIDNCDIINPNDCGIRIHGAAPSGCIITNNIIDGANGHSIATWSTGIIISENNISNGGVFNSLGLIDRENSIGIYNTGSGGIITYNRIENVGYNGIVFFGANHVISHNYINGACNVLDDGGGIYTYNGYDYSQPGAAGSVVTDNIVLNVFGKAEGYTGTTAGYGIYMDNNTHDVLIQDNIVAGTACGIYLHQNGNITVIGNLVMDATLLLLNQLEVENSYINNNTFYLTARTGSFVWFLNSKQLFMYQENASGIWNYNKYVGHYNSNVFWFSGAGRTFAEWKAATGQDANSTGDFSTLGTGEIEVLFYNDTKTAQAQNLSGYTWRDLNGNPVTSLMLQPFTGQILIRQ